MLTSLKDALEITLAAVDKDLCPSELISLQEAFGRVLSEPINVPEDVPAFDRSNMDGYAVLHSDIAGADADSPRILDVAEVVPTGYTPQHVVKAGVAIQVATGAMVPAQATAVVMKERTEKVSNSQVKIFASASAGDNIVVRGQDLKAGEPLLQPGWRLRPIDLAALSTLGVHKAPVRRRPRVAIIATGDELVEPGEPLTPGKIYNSSSYMLEAAIAEDFACPTRLPIVKDNLDDIVATIDTALSDHELLLVIGGSSVGEKDLTRVAIEKFVGHKVLLHGIAIRPGRPTIVATIQNRLVIGLPGHPVSTRAIYDVLVRPVLDEFVGLSLPQWLGRSGSRIEAVTTKEIAASADMDLFVRMRLTEKENAVLAEPITFSSFSISSLVKAHGWTLVKKSGQAISAGTSVIVTLF